MGGFSIPKPPNPAQKLAAMLAAKSKVASTDNSPTVNMFRKKKKKQPFGVNGTTG